jgi:hypothetical protein
MVVRADNFDWVFVPRDDALRFGWRHASNAAALILPVVIIL